MLRLSLLLLILGVYMKNKRDGEKEEAKAKTLDRRTVRRRKESKERGV